MRISLGGLLLVAASWLLAPTLLMAQNSSSLQERLSREGSESLAAAALLEGDAARGAIVFHQPQLACSRCHGIGSFLGSEGSVSIGPILTELPAETSDQHLVESILFPSKAIRAGFETIAIETSSGETIVGLPVDETDDLLRLRHPTEGRIIEIAQDQIEGRSNDQRSMMPEGQVEQIGGRQQFLDLVRYLIEIRDGGATRARELQPPDSLFALVLPEYESEVDHAGLVRSLDNLAFHRGEAIYERLCINCHGDREQPGSLPTAPRFATSALRNGYDPYSMYRTLTHGFGFMAPQTWMVPKQKYDVIHYVREAYFSDRTDGAYTLIDEDYLAQLPIGNTFGPEPIETQPWADMDYGPALINTYEIPRSTNSNQPHIAYKGIAVRLDSGPGGVSRGSAWMLFDHELMSMAAAWTADPNSKTDRFIDWNGIHFNGRHQIHPKIVGDLQLAHSMPGWADPNSNQLDDLGRVIGRDGRNYGPLPKERAKYRGLYAHGDRSIIDYSIGATRILELPGIVTTPPDFSALNNDAATNSSAANASSSNDAASTSIFSRTLHVAARPQPLRMAIATHPSANTMFQVVDGIAQLSSSPTSDVETSAVEFNGQTRIQVDQVDQLSMSDQDFTVSAWVRTENDGTIWCRTESTAEWVPNGKSFFIRGGHLCYDIGWVGAVQSDVIVDDGEPHHVAMSWQHQSGRVTFFVDGERAGQGTLRPNGDPDQEVVRIGYTSENFPDESPFVGELQHVAFHAAALKASELKRLSEVYQESLSLDADSPIDRVLLDSQRAHWTLDQLTSNSPVIDSISGIEGRVETGEPQSDSSSPWSIVASLSGESEQLTWSLDPDHPEVLCLNLPAGDEPLTFTVAFARLPPDAPIPNMLNNVPEPIDLLALVNPGPPRWPTVLQTGAPSVTEEGAFRVETLPDPTLNPWLALIRPTGLDFTADGESLLLTTWDGDVWRVDGLNANASNESTIDSDSGAIASLRWRRIASGLFQPLGIKLVDDVPYVTCRDQLVILRDHNGDGETDYYECFNDDHQVTEHFHEFAMGLQRDEQGRFYYAKSARHALPAVVPHHGTLLRVSADGSTTEIVATGFRAANGVCLNPDGSFIVTDQEGHWNPKNRINWVRENGFYGNMFGYHDVTDSSDDAMEAPLCWITNAFDRSPAELLWVESPKWGPLHGSLLNLSYGYGKVFVVPFEKIGDGVQGGMCELPMTPFPTGVMRGRFHADGNLYLCGMFAWAGSQIQPGGIYRIQPTGRPITVPLELHATKERVVITLSDPVDRESAVNPESYSVKVWGLNRTANYGSPHVNEHSLKVTGVEVSEDGKTLSLLIPELAPTWGMEIVARWKDADGEWVERTIHNTIHQLND